MVHHSQVIAEDEHLVFLDRAPQVAADVVIRQVTDRRVEERARVEVAVLQEFIRGAVDRVGSRFQHHIHHRARGAPHFRIVVGQRNVHGLDGFDRGNIDLKQPRPLIIVGALDHGVVAHARLAVDFGLQRAGGVEKL